MGGLRERPGRQPRVIAWAAGNEYNLTNNPAYDAQPVFSPDGSKIAFESDRAGSTPEIFVMGWDGTNPTNLTNSPSGEYSPEWSPNGSKIAFTSYRNDNFDISVMKADGSEKKRLTRNTTAESFPAFSPDGKKIAFMGHRGGNNYEIFALNVRTMAQQRLTNKSRR